MFPSITIPKKNYMKKLFSICTMFLFCTLLSAQHEHTYFPDPDPSIAQRLEEWQDLKFGLLMHWGAYSQWGIVESWSICPEDVPWATGARKKGFGEDDYNAYKNEYEKLINSFNPDKFNPEKWAKAAKNAGMKYMVFTTKHHDGFCMFDSKFTDYKITGPGCPFSAHPRSNVTKEIFDTFRSEGFWIGAYFSKPDWHMDAYWWKKFPVVDRNCNYQISKYPEVWKKYVDFTYNQVDELMTDYGKIDILWLDGGWVQKISREQVKNYLTDEYEGVRYSRNPQSQDIQIEKLALAARKKQPGILVVDRACPGPYQNYLTPEQHIPENGLPYPWETCMTMANSWSYVPDDSYKSADELIEKLVDIVSKGGNYLLNIGPGPDGQWHEEAYEKLHDIGSWIKTNGESIYYTRKYDVYGEGDKIRFTRSKDGKTKFIFVFDFPEGPLRISRMDISKNSKLTLLGSNRLLKWKALDEEESEIIIPPSMKETSSHVWVIKIEEP